jgi:hypothetical protein
VEFFTFGALLRGAKPLLSLAPRTALTSRAVDERPMKNLMALLLIYPVLAPAGLFAQTPATVRSPSEFHGYELGTRYTITAGLYDYYRSLAESSSRVEYREYGRSIQGRPLPMLVVSSEANLADQEVLQDRFRRLTDATSATPESELAVLTGSTPALVWIFIVDTDEEAGVEVLQEVAYELATRSDVEAQAIRDNTLIILTPLTNPDSHARYVTWHKLYNVAGASLDENAIENEAHWGMNTDGNAYGIDVNRDFGWFVTPEMQALAREMVAWRPQITLDVHSGPDVIFLPPFPRPFHPLWPRQAPDWWTRLAERASENFGRRGWTFNSRQGYEGVTSVGFGLSWGMLGSSVASFLYETFGGRPGKTLSFRRSDGTIATMRMAMDRHSVGIWSLLQLVAENREELLRDAHQAVVEGVEAARGAPVRGVAFAGEGEGVDPDKVSRLIQRLTLQGVEVRRAGSPFTLQASPFFALASSSARTFESGTYVVNFAQPRARLARALLDPTIDYDAPLVELPYGRRMPYYDVTWGALPNLFGVETFALREAPFGGNETPTTNELVHDGAARQGDVRTLGRAEPPYAWILPPGLESSYRIATRLMREGYRLRVFHAPFELAGERFDKGTLAAIRQRNPDGLGARLGQLVEEHGGTAIEIAGPFTEAGVSFGDESRLVAVPPPLVAVLADWPVAHDHIYGGIRNVLEADFGFAFSPVMLETINGADLSRYTAVVLPHAGMAIRGGPGFSAGYAGKLDVENLRRYVRGGGTLIAVKGAAAEVSRDSILGADLSFVGWASEANGAALRVEWVVGEPTDSVLAKWRPGLGSVGAPFVSVGLRATEFAAPGAYPVLLEADPGGGTEILARYGANATTLVLDGFVTEADRERIAGRPFLAIRRVGQGRVIYLADDPTYRGQWYGLNLLFLNLLLFGPML